MATTPVTRVTDLARDFRLDIDTATYPASNYEQLIGVEELKLVETLRTASDETATDDGADRKEVTGYSWSIEGKIKLSRNLAGTSRNAVHKFLRDKYRALRTGSAATNEFGIRWYNRDGLTDEADEGRVFVETWTTEGATASQNLATIKLTGQGPLTPVTNPASSQVPVVSGLSDVTGPAAGGELVMIYGDHFIGATAVDFGATAATDYEIISDSTIAAIAPAHAAGAVQVKVTTPAGASADTAADNYTYV